jgi:hypothetical protein
MLKKSQSQEQESKRILFIGNETKGVEPVASLSQMIILDDATKGVSTDMDFVSGINQTIYHIANEKFDVAYFLHSWGYQYTSPLPKIPDQSRISDEEIAESLLRVDNPQEATEWMQKHRDGFLYASLVRYALSTGAHVIDEGVQTTSLYRKVVDDLNPQVHHFPSLFFHAEHYDDEIKPRIDLIRKVLG